jgi:hypothetical protein
LDSGLRDTICITLNFLNGSIGVVNYLSNGNKGFPKERLEIFAENKILQLNNFRTLKGYGFPKFNKMNLWRQDKGQNSCSKSFISAIMNKSISPISFDEIIEVAKLTIEIDNYINGHSSTLCKL